MGNKFTKIKCKFCGDIIQSEYDGNFIRCKCGKTFVDEVRNGYIRSTEYGEVVK